MIVNGTATAVFENFNARRIAKGLPAVSRDEFERVLERASHSELEIAELACKRILARLQLLPEGPAATIRTDGQAVHASGSGRLRTRPGPWQNEHVGGRGDPAAPKSARFTTSTIPEGVRVDGGHEGAPSKLFSLWAHYSYRIDQARQRGDAFALLRLAACATRDYEIATRQRPAYHENHEAAVTELLRDCAGVSAIEAAWYLGAPMAWVKQQRVRHRRDPETGEPIAGRDTRIERIFALRAEGMKQAEIAEAVGLTQPRVSEILAGK